METVKMPKHRWMDKEYMYEVKQVEFYSIIMKDKIISFVRKWMELEIIILSKIT
jgi:hypothetical protein